MVHSQHNSMRVFQWYVIERLLPGTRTPAPRLMQEQADREVNRVLEYCLVFSACFGCYGAWWRCSLGSSVPSRLHGVPLRLLRCLILPLLHSFYCYIAQCDAPSAAASLGVLLRLLRRLVCSFGCCVAWCAPLAVVLVLSLDCLAASACAFLWPLVALGVLVKLLGRLAW